MFLTKSNAWLLPVNDPDVTHRADIPQIDNMYRRYMERLMRQVIP